MGIVENIKTRWRKNRARAKVKAQLRKNLENEQWKADYDQACEELGVKPDRTQGKKAGHYRGGAGWLNSGYSGGAKWEYGLSTGYPGTDLDHYKLRQGARQAMQDTPMARALVSRLHTSIVGRGLKAQFMPNAELLGITPEQAEKWGSEATQLFHTWASSKKSHRAQRMNFYQAQDLYAMWQQRDNDMFTRLYYSTKKDLPSPVQFEFIDPNQIQGTGVTYSDYQTDQQTDIDGIIKNPDGTERVYKVMVILPGGKVKTEEIPAKGPKSGRQFMIHGYKPEYAGQDRGFSPLAHALQDFENATDFASAMIKKAINQANQVFAIENQQQDASDGGLEFKMGGGVQGHELETTQEVIETEKGFEIRPINEALFNTPGSHAFTVMQQGDTVKMLDNKVPGESFDSFITPFFSFLSASLNTPIEIVLLKFNQNYSASRAAIVMFHRIIMMWRDEIKADFTDPIIEAVISEWIASGRISAPGWQDSILRAAWMEYALIGTPLPSIDPVKEATANMLNMEMGADNMESVAQAHNGSSAKKNITINSRLFPQTPVPPWKDAETMPEDKPQEENDGE